MYEVVIMTEYLHFYNNYVDITFMVGNGYMDIKLAIKNLRMLTKSTV